MVLLSATGNPLCYAVSLTLRISGTWPQHLKMTLSVTYRDSPICEDIYMLGGLG